MIEKHLRVGVRKAAAERRHDSLRAILNTELIKNGRLGTEHGHDNMMMLLGGGINGGKVYAKWPGLHDEQLKEPATWCSL